MFAIRIVYTMGEVAYFNGCTVFKHGALPFVRERISKVDDNRPTCMLPIVIYSHKRDAIEVLEWLRDTRHYNYDDTDRNIDRLEIVELVTVKD